jgi:hypothetical protein
MTLELSVVRGPLAEEDLDAIGATYGAAVDPRYASREFCRAVFNGNPSGYSFHAFVRDGARTVGHYAIVPMRARARGSTVLSGKGEALYMAEAYRKSMIATPAGEALVGLAMMNALHERALAGGVAFIHSVTTPAVAVLLRMQGFRVLKLTLDQLHFLVRPPELKESTRFRALLARLTSAVQRVLLAAARAGLRLTGAPRTEVDPAAHEGGQLAAFSATDGQAGATWAVSRDLENLAWMKRLGRLEIVSIAGRPDRFAVLVRAQRSELLHWSVPATARRDGLAIVCGILARGARTGTGTFSVSRRLLADAGPSLRFALRLLAFVPARIPISLLVKTDDDFYARAENVDFSRMFHL